MAQNNQSATNITARINVLNAVPNLDINYGPYDNVESAVATLRSIEAVCQGLTVGIYNNDKSEITEYWFKSNVNSTMTVEELVPLLIMKNTTDYDNLSNIPKINNITLNGGNNTLTAGDVNAASSLDFNRHVDNAFIHTTVSYGNAEEYRDIKGIYLDGEKLTFLVGDDTYEFRLTKWYDIADFYILFGTLRYQNNILYAEIGNNLVPYNETTADQFIQYMSVDERGVHDTSGYMVKDTKDKELFYMSDGSIVKCDYIITYDNVPTSNAMLVMYRTSGTNLPSLSQIVTKNELGETDYLFDAEQSYDNTTPAVKLPAIKGEYANYDIVGIFQPGASLGDSYGINFRKS